MFAIVERKCTLQFRLTYGLALIVDGLVSLVTLHFISSYFALMVAKKDFQQGD